MRPLSRLYPIAYNADVRMNRVNGSAALLRFVVAVAALHAMAKSTFAQIIENAPRNFVLDGAVNEWPKDGASFTRSGSARNNPIWVARTNEGLVLAGTVDGFHVAASIGELSSSGRLEIWLSATDSIEMPPMNWFGDTPPEERCDDPAVPSKPSCLEWYRDQSAYRAKMKALFTRMWRVAPNLIEEAEASVAYESLSAAQKATARQLKPSEFPTAKFSIDARNKLSYEILVPWQAFPPVEQVSLERVNLTLNVLQGDSVLATTDHSLPDIRHPAMPSFALFPPILAHFTPCEYPLGRGPDTPVYAFLDASLNVRDAFTFHDRMLCCGAFVYPPPDSVSPEIVPVTRTVQRIGAGEFVCSSPVAYRKGTSISQSSFDADIDAYSNPSGDPTAPDKHTVFRLRSGSLLVRSMSWKMQEQSYTMCAACPWVGFAIYLITRSGEIKEALSLGPVRLDMLELSRYDVEVSSDWGIVTEFRNRNEEWTATKYCLKSETYEQCGVISPSEPPKHGIFPSQ